MDRRTFFKHLTATTALIAVSPAILADLAESGQISPNYRNYKVINGTDLRLYVDGVPVGICTPVEMTFEMPIPGNWEVVEFEDQTLTFKDQIDKDKRRLKR